MSGLALDLLGTLYGTAALGGTYHGGTVYQMTLGPGGWAFQVLYDFCSQPNCSDGGSPHVGVLLDNTGNLFGTAFNVFQMTPAPGGWTERVLHDFCSEPNCKDGGSPYAGVILDAKGNLYGTTVAGGTYNGGTVFKLKDMPDGSWKHRVLHSFGSFAGDGLLPGSGNLVFDDAGNLYGTTHDGGTCCGTVFRLTRQPIGHWKETILHNFKLGKSGRSPNAGVVIDSAGNLYGVTMNGGTDCDCGVVYELSPSPDGTWTYSVLHRFNGYDGFEPAANLILDNQGNLYGTTMFGGPSDGGVVFQITP